MIGEQVGTFRILEKLGEGGMGVVYKGIDVQLGRPVAVKMLSAELARNAELVERFRTEARAQAQLNHVNLATLYAFLVEDGSAFMVMEYVDGETFEEMVRRSGPMPPEDAVPLFKQALLGIGAAHRMGIVHRDIKPSNLMRNRQGIVKVMDFGIAKLAGSRGMTRTGVRLGTPAYMAPEQIQNHTVDVRTDIYALGITLYQMLSGQVPFDSDSDFDVMQDHVTATPPPMKQMYPYAPVQYENVVRKALEKSPSDRFQTVEEFGAALDHPESVAASPGARTETPTNPVLKPTAMEVATSPSSTAARGSVSSSPAPKAPSGVNEMKRRGWTVRHTFAAGSAGIVVVVLAVLLSAHIKKVPIPNSSSLTASPIDRPHDNPPPEQPPAVGNPGNDPDQPKTGESSSATTPRHEQSHSGSTSTRRSDAALPSLSTTAPRPHPKTDASPTQANPPAPPANSGMSQQEIDAVEKEIDDLSSRAVAINSSLDNLKQQMGQQGLSPRGDIVAAQANMQLNLSKAQDAMERHDPVSAKKYADRAESSVKTLEHFLGR